MNPREDGGPRPGRGEGREEQKSARHDRDGLGAERIDSILSRVLAELGRYPDAGARTATPRGRHVVARRRSREPIRVSAIGVSVTADAEQRREVAEKVLAELLGPRSRLGLLERER